MPKSEWPRTMLGHLFTKRCDHALELVDALLANARKLRELS
jgi:hypothetical protein